MPGNLIGEQFLMIGAVDIPATTENTMKLLGKLGAKGYLPSVIREISLVDGKSQNRISLTNMVDVNIGFNSDRIQIARSHRLGARNSEVLFQQLVADLCDALKEDFSLDIHRVVLVREMMKEERDKSTYARVCKRFLAYGSDDNPFEWFSRTSNLVEKNGGEFLKVVEVWRAQGVVQHVSMLAPFDAIQTKIEVGTNMLDKSLRFTVKSAAELMGQLNEILESTAAELDNVYRG